MQDLSFESLDGVCEVLSDESPGEEDLLFGFRCVAHFVYSLLRREGLSPSDAETLAIETTGHVVLRISTFKRRGSGSFAAWCRTIALNRMKNWYRAREHEHLVSRDFWDQQESAVSLTEIRGDVSKAPNELAKLAWRQLGTLSSRSRRVLLLRAIDGLPFSEIAARTDITETYARKLYQRAKADVAQQLSTHIRPNE